MKKGLLRTCAGVLAALMLIETAFTGNLSARVYAGEVEEVYEEVVDETAEEAVQTLSEEEEVIVTEEETVSEQNLADVDTVYSIYFNLDGGTLATNPARLLDARYDTTDGSKTIRQVIEEQVEFADGEELEDAFIPQREGYNFGGWIDEEGNDFNFDSTLDSNVTATAMWIPKKTAKSLSINITNEPEIVHQYDVVEIISEEPNAQIYYKLVQEDVPTSLYDENVADGYNRYIGKKTIRDIINCDVYCTESITIKAKAVKEGCPDVVETRTIIIEPDWGDIPEDVQTSKYHDDLCEVPAGIWVEGLNDSYNYIAEAITAEKLDVYCGTKLLKENSDYIVSYANNTNAYEIKENAKGFNSSIAPALVITGKGNYAGTYKNYFVINKIDISTLLYDDLSTVYNGSIQRLVPRIRFQNKYLKNGTDYKVGYPDTTKDYKSIGEYRVKVVGAGNFKGDVTLTERIAKKSLDGVKVEGICSLIYDPDYVYGDDRYWVHSDMGKALQVYVNVATKLLEGVDYELVYVANPPKVGATAMKIVGLGDYAGTRIYDYKITDGSDSTTQFNFANVYVEGFSEEFEYNGLACDQSGDIKVYKGKGQTLLEYGKDYTIAVKSGCDNVNVGEVTLYIVPLKDDVYYGKKELTFKIVPRSLGHNVQILTGNVATLVDGIAEASVELKYADKTLELGKDYTISYINNTHTVTATEIGSMETEEKPAVIITGKGNYKATATRFFLIEGSNFDTVRLTPVDKAYVAKADNYTTYVYVKDAKGNELTAGKDYDKKYKYYYVDETLLENGIVRAARAEVVEGDMVPYGTCLRVEITPLGSYAFETGRDEQNNPIYKTLSATYRISGLNIAKAKITVSNEYYTGNEVTLDNSQIKIVYGNRYLSENDYEIVGYKNNIKAGNAVVTLRGLGDFYGTVDVEFIISKEGLGKMIRYNPNAIVSSGVMGSQYVTTYGTTASPVRIMKNKFVRDYYEFVGWNTEADGSGYDVPANATLSSIDALLSDKALVLYAVWKPIEYTVTVHPNGGNFDTSLIPSKITYDTVIEELAVPDISTWPKGYMFGGWYLEDTYKTRISSISRGTHENIHLYAKWTAYTYTIKYNSNAPVGKSCLTKMANTVISYGQEKALSPNRFAITGYVFDGWSTDPSDGYGHFVNGQKVSDKDFEEFIEPQNNIEGEVVLYAIWRETFYVYLNVNADDATISSDSFEYAYGSSHTLETPVRTGYIFGGWYTDETYKTRITSITSKMGTDYYLFAKWTPVSYSVVFNKNAKDATGTMSAITLKYDVSKELSNNRFVRKGFEFTGWNTQSDGEGDSYSNCEIIDNLATKNGAKVNLYAQWDSTSYSITYHDNGGTRVTSGPSSYNYGEAFTLPTATRYGYIFGGWYKEETFKNKIGAIKATNYGDLDLYAKWTVDKTMLNGRSFAITVVNNPEFNWNGASIPGSYVYGSTITFPSGATAPLRYGYTFAGWFTTPTYSKKITGITAKTSDDITLYAKWTPKTYSVTYKINVPTGVESKTVTGKDFVQGNFRYEVETALKKNTFKIKGYTFMGWSLTSDGSVLYDDAAKIKGANSSGNWLCQNETLYAVWEKDEYSITYMNVSGLTNNNPDTYDVDDEFTLEEPQRVGYTFKGWYLDAGYTKKISKFAKYSTGNKTLYAKWTSTVYNIKYVKNDEDDSTTKILSGLVGYVINYFKKADGGYVLPSATRRGYKFMGWSLKATGENPVFALKTAPTTELIYYAVWEPEQYKITYHYQYEENKEEKKEVATYSISKSIQKLKSPVRYGYEFNGWHIGSVDGTIATNNVIPANGIGDVELYADWKTIKYKIEYDSNGANVGIWTDSDYHLGNDYFYLPSGPSKNGKVFMGWRINGKIYAGGEKVNAQKLGIFTSGMTISAKAVWGD